MNVELQHVDALHSAVRESAALIRTISGAGLFDHCTPTEGVQEFSDGMYLLGLLEERLNRAGALIDAHTARRA